MRYFDINFTDDQHPIIILYHSMAFWMGHYDKEDTNNQTISIAKKLHDISIAIDNLYGTIKFEIFAVTRNRLIQTGQTNGYTYDFETFQNLIFGTLIIEPYNFTFSKSEDLGFNNKTDFDVANSKSFIIIVI